MHPIWIYVPLLFACTSGYAEPVAPRSVQAGSPSPASVEGAKRRSDLKSVLRSNGQEGVAGSGSMDAAQREQMRQQLREQSGK